MLSSTSRERKAIRKITEIDISITKTTQTEGKVETQEEHSASASEIFTTMTELTENYIAVERIEEQPNENEILQQKRKKMTSRRID